MIVLFLPLGLVGIGLALAADSERQARADRFDRSVRHAKAQGHMVRDSAARAFRQRCQHIDDALASGAVADEAAQTLRAVRDEWTRRWDGVP